MTTRDLTDAVETLEVSTSVLGRIRGLMFRDLPDDGGYARVHVWDRVAERTAHTMFARASADAYWLVDGEVRAHEWLVRWGGNETHEGDALVYVVGDHDIDVGDVVEY